MIYSVQTSEKNIIIFTWDTRGGSDDVYQLKFLTLNNKNQNYIKQTHKKIVAKRRRKKQNKEKWSLNSHTVTTRPRINTLHLFIYLSFRLCSRNRKEVTELTLSVAGVRREHLPLPRAGGSRWYRSYYHYHHHYHYHYHYYYHYHCRSLLVDQTIVNEMSPIGKFATLPWNTWTMEEK